MKLTEENTKILNEAKIPIVKSELKDNLLNS